MEKERGMSVLVGSSYVHKKKIMKLTAIRGTPNCKPAARRTLPEESVRFGVFHDYLFEGGVGASNDRK